MNWLLLVTAFLAGLGTVAGGLLVFVRKEWEHSILKFSIAFGAGFMLSAAALAMLPESLKLRADAPIFFLAGYLTIHFFEHTIIRHFHFGEETHAEAVVDPIVGYSSIFGLSIHNLFDGISIGAGFAVSHLLGLLIFGAVILHKLPDGFTMASIMLASGRTRKAAFGAALLLGFSTLFGALAMSLLNRIVPYALPFSAGVTFYIAATDLVPIINESHRLRYSFAFFAGILIFYLTDQLLDWVLF